MSLRVEPGPLSTEIELPASKSYANRYLILAARYGLGAAVENLPSADDVTKLIGGLQAVGIRLRSTERGLEFLSSFPECESSGEPLEVRVGEGGTTGRFLLALLSAGKRTYRLKLAGRLAQRPWDELTDTLRAAGARIEFFDDVIEVQGPVDPRRLPRSVPADRSTQFLTALQLAFFKDGIHFDGSQVKASLPYWKMTVACVEQLEFSSIMTVPLDWSSAAYPMCLAAVLGQEVTLPGLRLDPNQADSALFALLKSRGSARESGGLWRRKSITVSGLKDRSAIDMDLARCPDLAPALAFLCAHLEGTSVLRGLGSLVHKESDRLTAIHQLLVQVGTRASVDGDRLVIPGGVGTGPWQLSTPADHRLVMTAALFLRAHDGGTLEHPESVEKSFPNYFKVMGF